MYIRKWGSTMRPWMVSHYEGVGRLCPRVYSYVASKQTHDEICHIFRELSKARAAPLSFGTNLEHDLEHQWVFVLEPEGLHGVNELGHWNLACGDQQDTADTTLYYSTFRRMLVCTEFKFLPFDEDGAKDVERNAACASIDDRSIYG